MIWIRCDANGEIGMGHLMRCLSVADALEQSGEKVCFVMADNSAEKLLKDRKKAVCVLDTDYRDVETELPVLLPQIQKEKPAMLLIDSYRVTPDYLSALRKQLKTIYMDDLFRFPYPVDMLINYNIYGDLLPYKEAEELKNTKLLLGPAYAPLRREFQDASYVIKDKVENVLLTTGGSDKYNLAGLILQEVLKEDMLSQVRFHVVSGAFNLHLPFLEKLEAENTNICVHKNVTQMADLMKQCDLAVTAGGSTMYELCAIGVPTLCFSFVDNQEQIVKTFTDKDIVLYGGNYLTQGEGMVKEISEKLKLLLTDKEAREACSRKERALVDGMGAMRIAKALLPINKVD